jgi:peptidoglycan/xylan/chitin deacetylase (PgdA/CDA1 family)
VSTVAILAYHRVGSPGPSGWETWFQIPESTFASHLATLADGGWEVLGADRFLDGLADPTALPERAAVITFDDGHSCVLDVALPHLRESGFPAVLFMPSDFVGGSNEFDLGREPEGRLCDWAELRQLARAGVSIQSHCASHRALSELSPLERREELTRSKAVLEAGTGASIDMLSFPFGDDADGGLRRELEEIGYRAAFLYGGEPLRMPARDRYRLPRVTMGPDTDLRATLAKVAGAA